MSILLPLNFGIMPGAKLSVAAAKVAAAKETIVSRKRRGMSSLKDKVFLWVDKGFFRASIAAPEKEDEVRLTIVKITNGVFGENFPAFAAMAAGAVGFDGKSII